MHNLKDTTKLMQRPGGTRAQGGLDLAAIEVARRSLDPGSATPGPDSWHAELITLLNDSLATELVCVLRYKRHHFTAHGLASLTIRAEFLKHAAEEAMHADRLAKRIVQLGGQPDFEPESLSRRSHAAYDASLDLKAMISADLVAERVACESYQQLITRVGDRDSTTRRLLEDILAEEQSHAAELEDWLAQ
jgi:bacterioferritin